MICRNKDIPFGTKVNKDISDKSMHLGEFILNLQSDKIEWSKKKKCEKRKNIFHTYQGYLTSLAVV